MKKNIIVYVIHVLECLHDISNDEFVRIATEKGRIYNLLDFQIAFNMGEINSELDSIRFINI